MNQKLFSSCKKRKPTNSENKDTLSLEKNFFQDLIESKGNLTPISKEDLQKIALKKRRASNSFEVEEKTMICYKKRVATFEDNSFVKKIHLNSNELVCPVCMDFIIKATITTCGHTFCERCLSEALHLAPGCPICRYPLRNSEMTTCKSLDHFIQRFIENSENLDLGKSYQERVQDYENWKKSIRLPGICKENDVIDVRDSEYIWCVGTVLKTKIQKNQKVVYLIHYKGWSDIFDEFISATSPRLAVLGAYTKRLDIPRYIINEGADNNVRGFLTNGFYGMAQRFWNFPPAQNGARTVIRTFHVMEQPDGNAQTESEPEADDDEVQEQEQVDQ